MKKFTQEEYLKRIDEIENLLFKNLSLRKILSVDELNEFFTTMIAYLQHSNSEELVGRTPETLENNINKFIDFCKKIGLNDKDIINVIKEFPSILHSSKDIEEKYILMSLVENETNSLRKNKLLERPRDYIIDVDLLYARYALASSLNYELTWNSLVKNSEKEFAEIFTKKGYYKPYKIFNDISDCSSDKLKTMYPLDINFINELKELEINACMCDKGKKHE